MFRKLLAGLAILGMLMVGGVATAKNMSEDIPLAHKLAYKITNPDLAAMVQYVWTTGDKDFMALIFGGVKRSKRYFANEDVTLLFEDYTKAGGPAMFIMDIPYTEGRSLILLELFNDGDTLVDAVGIRDGSRIIALRYIGEEIPSIYSSVYNKHLCHLIHEYMYNAPIEHAVIDMGPVVGVENDA